MVTRWYRNPPLPSNKRKGKDNSADAAYPSTMVEFQFFHHLTSPYLVHALSLRQCGSARQTDRYPLYHTHRLLMRIMSHRIKHYLQSISKYLFDSSLHPYLLYNHKQTHTSK